MLRISRGDRREHAEILKVEGTLAGPATETLRSAAEVSLSSGARLRLDLSGLTFVDANGVELLRDLKARDVELCAPSAFVRELIKQERTGA